MGKTYSEQQSDILAVQSKALVIILKIVIFGTAVFTIHGIYAYFCKGVANALLATILSFLLMSVSVLSLFLIKIGKYALARTLLLTTVFFRAVHWLIVIPDALFPIAVTFTTLFIIVGIFLSTPKEGFSWLGLGFLISFLAILVRNLYHIQYTLLPDPQMYFYAVYFFPMICMTIITTICLYVVRQFQTALSESAAARKSLEQTNKTLESFAYVASHDLQEPLRTITTYAQLVERDNENKLDQDSKDNISSIVAGAKRMRQLINDLLHYSRLKTQTISFQPTSLNEIMSQVLNNLKSSIEESDAQMKVDDLPIVSAHPSQMTQLFQNLIGNAIKFRSQETPLLEITVIEQKTNWLFSVKDNGIGLDPEHREKIFEIFQRLNSHEKYSGSGMGLAISQEIVTIHGGKIWVESTPGKGSIFFFTLPKKQT